ncbi:MAG: hypothetical protein Ct9H300mP16_16500 [Pseudomonadota bacterium]|nr:MAG: hypothetical protein Ct9H300mP16_16500 [Pseudomonadota bacterium]
MLQIDTNPAAPKVRIYDFGIGPNWSRAHYQRAIDDGAEMVIGPLGKKAIGTLSELKTLPVPTLVLGVSDGLPGDQAIGFSLSPEDETFAVIRRAHRAGFRRAAILYPDSDWGRRMILATRHHWEQFDGSIVAQSPYFQSASDHSTTLKRLLASTAACPDSNDSKYYRPETKIRFAPRRRQDLDVLGDFGPGACPGETPEAADRLSPGPRPAGFFHQPYFFGRPDPVANLDRERCNFWDIPWMLTNRWGTENSRLRDSATSSPYTAARVVCLGVDAYALSTKQLNCGQSGSKPPWCHGDDQDRPIGPCSAGHQLGQVQGRQRYQITSN